MADFLEDDPNAIQLKQVTRKKGAKGRTPVNVTNGIVHVVATFNNTKVSVSDVHGNVLAWSSAGKMGFKGSRKSTAYAAQLVATEASKRAMTYGMREVEVRVKGPGAGRESAGLARGIRSHFGRSRH